LHPVDRYPFLSDEWVAAARQIRAEYGDLEEGVPNNIRMNQIITEVPFGDGNIEAHTDTTSGSLEMDLGHLDKADVTVTLDYDTAKAVFVDGTVTAAMKAFMEGRVRVQGEMSKLLAALGQLTPSDESSVNEVQQKIRDITA
jgi:putative sterol carrier protein